MALTTFIAPAVVAAIISGIIGPIIGIRMRRAADRELAKQRENLQAQKLAFDRELTEQRNKAASELQAQKFAFDHELAKHQGKIDERLLKLTDQLNNPTRAGAENSLRIFFDDRSYPKRSRLFSSIKRTIAGFEDNELRKILLGIGATQRQMTRGEGWHLRAPPRDPDE